MGEKKAKLKGKRNNTGKMRQSCSDPSPGHRPFGDAGPLQFKKR
jgi:hypothetical protein